jgi:hypothetical protein
MLIKRLSLLGSLLLSGAVLAQGTSVPAPVIGSAADVQGLVTISDAVSIANVVDGSELAEGSRIVTSSTGSVTLKTVLGCDIRLQPNQSIVLGRLSTCEALLASVQSLPGSATIATNISAQLVSLALLRGPELVVFRSFSSGNPNLSSQ